jgi:hypothetical protein
VKVQISAGGVQESTQAPAVRVDEIDAAEIHGDVDAEADLDLEAVRVVSSHGDLEVSG